jgi:hypothetical protein
MAILPSALALAGVTENMIIANSRQTIPLLNIEPVLRMAIPPFQL